MIQETCPTNSLVANPNDLHLRNNLKDRDDDSEDFNYPTLKRRKNHKNRKRKHKNKRKQKQKEQQRKLESNELTKRIITLKERLKSKSAKNKEPTTSFIDGNNSNFSEPLWHGDNGIFKDYEITNDSTLTASAASASNNNDEEDIYGHNTTFMDEDKHRENVQNKKSTWNMLKQATIPPPSWSAGGDSSENLRLPIEGYFCDSPSKDYSHFVIERIGPNATETLFDRNSLLAMCQLQEQITNVHKYEEYCDREMISNNCCRPWSLSNYVALLANKSSCFDITVSFWRRK